MVDPNYETSPSNHTCVVVDTSVNTFFMVVYSLVFLVGLPLNGFIIKFYCCGARQQASSSLMVYLKNLTAADFLLCLSLPLRITHYRSRSIIIWQLYCSFGASAFYLNMCASIMFMGYIAADRYLKIVHPSGTRVLQTVRTAHIISMITWIFLMATGIIFIILFFITQKSVPSSISRCVLIFSPLVTVFFKIIQALCVVTFLLVFIYLVFFYYSTSCRVLEAQQRQLASFGSEKLVKSRRNMLVLVSIFCVCFVPYYLVRLPSAFLWSSCSVGPALYYLQEVTTMIAAFNVCLDPLVYFFLSKTFQAQVRMALRKTNIQQANEEREKQLDIIISTTNQTSEL